MHYRSTVLSVSSYWRDSCAIIIVLHCFHCIICTPHQDTVVSRGDFSDAIPGLADEFSIDPDHGRVVLPENLILKETQHTRRSLSPSRDRSLSPARGEEQSPTPRGTKSGVVANHCHEDDRQTRKLF